MANEKTTQIIEAIKGMTILELADLVKEVEETFGVSAAVAVGPVAAAGDAPAAAEQTEFDVILKDAGASKMGVIKALKDLCGLGLKEAKEIVDAAPKAIKEKVSYDEAEKAKAALEAAGAEVEIK